MWKTPDGLRRDLPLALLVGRVGGATRTLAASLENAGYAVLAADVAADALQRVRGAAPDAILLDAELPDATGISACETLRREGRLGAGTVVALVLPEEPTRGERVEALRAGVTECFTAGGDMEELLLRLDALVRPKLEADRARLDGFCDAVTGLYNQVGIVQRAREITSLMFRERGALSCLMLIIEPAGRGGIPAAAIARCAEALGLGGRRSDVLGQTAPGEFVVLAPDTREAGAVDLAERLGAALQQALTDASVRAEVRVGYEVIPNVRYDPVEPVALLLRARTAVRAGRPNARVGWIRRFVSTAAETTP